MVTMKATLNTESASDERLVLNSRNGDRDAFARIVERYQSLICALTYGVCGDLQTSEDLAQVTFITAWSELPKLQEPSKLKSWLCGIARNVTNKRAEVSAINSSQDPHALLTVQPRTIGATLTRKF